MKSSTDIGAALILRNDSEGRHRESDLHSSCNCLTASVTRAGLTGNEADPVDLPTIVDSTADQRPWNEREALDVSLVHEREQPVLVLGLAASISTNSAPDRGRRLEEPDW